LLPSCLKARVAAAIGFNADEILRVISIDG
jgi:hypothetical protein